MTTYFESIPEIHTNAKSTVDESKRSQYEVITDPEQVVLTNHDDPLFAQESIIMPLTYEEDGSNS